MIDVPSSLNLADSKVGADCGTSVLSSVKFCPAGYTTLQLAASAPAKVTSNVYTPSEAAFRLEYNLEAELAVPDMRTVLGTNMSTWGTPPS